MRCAGVVEYADKVLTCLCKVRFVVRDCTELLAEASMCFVEGRISSDGGRTSV